MTTMKVDEIRAAFLATLKTYEADIKFEKLADDNDFLRFIVHTMKIHATTYPDLNDLFDDDGFVEFMQSQLDDPITFEDMTKEG